MSSPYRAGVPFPGGGGNPYPYAVASQPSPFIEAGTMRFTKEKDKMGYYEYCIYRAEPRTVVGPSGPVDGMQWMLMEKVDRPPLDIYPASPDVYATFGKKISEAEYQRNIKEWEREYEKADVKEQERTRKEWEHEQARMARYEEKMSARRIKELEAGRRRMEEDEWGEDRPRQRRLSDAGYGINYPRARSRSRARANSFGQDELARQMAEMRMDRPYETAQNRNRKISFSDQVPPRAEYVRSRRTSQSYASNAALYDPGTTVGGPPVTQEYPRYNKSPYPREGQLPPLRRGDVAVYPPGHIKEGQLIPGFVDSGLYSERPPRSPRMGSVSGSYRARSPMPEGASASYSYRASSPRPRSRRQSMSRSVSDLPIAFSRAPSHAVSYTPFKPFTILRNLDILWDDELPPLPAALLPHDVHHEEWAMCLSEIKRAWSWQADIKKRDKIVAKILDTWNAYFFIPRKVELLLFKGSQRRSGPHVGLHDPVLGGFGDDYISDESESSLSSDEFDLDEPFGWYSHDKYGNDPWMAQVKEARRARKERRLKEKRKRSHRKGNELPYSLHLLSVEDEEPYSYDRRSVPALI